MSVSKDRIGKLQRWRKLEISRNRVPSSTEVVGTRRAHAARNCLRTSFDEGDLSAVTMSKVEKSVSGERIPWKPRRRIRKNTADRRYQGGAQRRERTSKRHSVMRQVEMGRYVSYQGWTSTGLGPYLDSGRRTWEVGVVPGR